MTRAEEHLTRELTDAAKNWLAIDGLWFQAVEQEYGMETALEMDRRVWEQFSIIEARKILTRLDLPRSGGLDALEIALKNRLFHIINEQQIVRPDKKNPYPHDEDLPGACSPRTEEDAALSLQIHRSCGFPPLRP